MINYLRQNRFRDEVRLGVLTFFILCCVGTTYFFHFIIGTEILIANLFYLPIALASFWFGWKGILMPLFLGGWLMISHALSDVSGPHIDDLLRFAMFISVGALVSGLNEQRLRSERKLKSIIKISTEWLWEVDTQGIYTYASPKVKDILGYEVSELLGKTPIDLMPEEEAKRLGKFFREKLLNKEPFYNLENVNRHKDGHLVTLNTSGIPILNKKGELKGYRGINRDISSHKEFNRKLEQEVSARTLELSVLSELSRKIGYALDYEEIFKFILKYLHKAVDYDICAFFFFKGDSGFLRIREAGSLNNRIIEQAKVLLLDAFKDMHDARIDERKLTMTVERSKESAKDHPPLKGELRSFINVPLFSKDKTIGMINISSLRQDAFSKGDIHLLYTIANQASTAMSRVELLLHSERSKTEKAVESMADGVIVIDENREVVVVNPMARKALHIDSRQGATVEGICKLIEYDPALLLIKEEQAPAKNEVYIHGVYYQTQVSSIVGSE